MKKSKSKEPKFASYKKLWKLYKIARGKSPDNPSDPNRVKYAKKLKGVAKGLYKKGLIEKLPVFLELS